MDNSRKSDFKTLLSDVFTMYSKEINKTLLVTWWNILEPYTFEQVERAFGRHLATSKFFPTPNHILDHLPDLSGHPGPEEAFNLVPKGDYESGYVTDQMMEALSVADEAIQRGDMIAARMAFVETYKKAVNAASAQGIKAKFWYSQATGGTHEQRLETKKQHVIEAERKGWITNQTALKSLENISNALGQDLAPAVAMLSSPSSQNLQRIESTSSKAMAALPQTLEPTDSIKSKVQHLDLLISFEKDEENKKRLIDQKNNLIEGAA